MRLQGSCHCKATVFEVDGVPDHVVQCTCSICSKRGALWAYYAVADFHLKTPQEDISTYRWNTKSAKLNFCGICGCTTFTETPDWSSGTADYDNPQIAVNSRLFDDFDLDAVEVVTIDGKNLW